jgi:hypothetical protein
MARAIEEAPEEFRLAELMAACGGDVSRLKGDDLFELASIITGRLTQRITTLLTDAALPYNPLTALSLLRVAVCCLDDHEWDVERCLEALRRVPRPTSHQSALRDGECGN